MNNQANTVTPGTRKKEIGQLNKIVYLFQLQLLINGKLGEIRRNYNSTYRSFQVGSVRVKIHQNTTINGVLF